MCPVVSWPIGALCQVAVASFGSLEMSVAVSGSLCSNWFSGYLRISRSLLGFSQPGLLLVL